MEDFNKKQPQKTNQLEIDFDQESDLEKSQKKGIFDRPSVLDLTKEESDKIYEKDENEPWWQK